MIGSAWIRIPSARRLALIVPLSVVALAATATSRAEPAPEWLHSAAEGRRGGGIVVAVTAEPKTLNPAVAVDGPSRRVIHLLHADLVRIHRQRQTAGPALARQVTAAEDGRRFRIELRRGVRFSDGEPFDADDVVFTFRVLLDPSVAAPARSALVVGDQPVTARKIDSHTVELDLAVAHAPGLRLLDSIFMLPEHLLGESYRQGELASTWGLDQAGEVAGLGPFRIREHQPGQRLVLERNPHYWKVDAAGTRLPYLDRLALVYVADGDSRALHFRAGESQLIEGLDADSFNALEGAADLDLRDLGAGLRYEFLYFNLNDVDPQRLPEVARKQRWFRSREFRRAVSIAVDRPGIARLVYGGRATPIASHITPGNKLWRNERLQVPQRSLGEARQLLREAGFTWSSAGGLIDPLGEPVSLSLVTNSTNPRRVHTATVVQQDLRQLGMEVRVVSLEFRALLARLLDSFDFELCILGLGGGNVDPSSSLNVWRSDGSNHLWQLGAKTLDRWQIRLDALLEQQMTELDPTRRKDLVDQVQVMVAAHLPFVFLVSPNVLVGASRDLGNFAPATLEPSTLWNADELYLRPGPT